MRPSGKTGADSAGVRTAGGRPAAKKSLGQHFLVDRNMTARIVRAAGIAPGDRVLEIGPGQGHLTEALVAAGALVTAIETDRELTSILKERFAGAPSVEITGADALTVSFEGLCGAAAGGGRLKCVSNLPYNISGPILFKIFKERGAFGLAVLMLQKEVAERVAARPATRDYGVLSVLLQTYFNAKVAFNVPPGVFRPRPNVDSSVLVLTPLPVPAASVEDEEFFIKVVKGAFSRRRKTLANALRAVISDGALVLKALEAAGIDPIRRPETLTPAEFAALAAALKRG